MEPVIGMRVVCIKEWCGNKRTVGEIGTIFHLYWENDPDNSDFSVQFDNLIGGHCGDGSGEAGHCWDYPNLSYFKPLYDSENEEFE